MFNPAALVVAAGSSTSWTVKLMSEPDGGDVTVSILPGDADLTVSHSLLTFAPADWNEARTVTAAGVPPGVRITPLPPPPTVHWR